MRILTITNLFPNPYQPQLAVFNRHQVVALREAGHEIEVISPIPWTVELTARRSGKPPLPDSRQINWDGIPVNYPRFVFTPQSLRGWHGLFYLWSVRRVFQKVCRRLHPDVIFATWAFPDGWAGVRLARWANLPIVLKVHGSDLLQVKQYSSRLSGTRETLREVDRIVAVSQDLANQAVEMGATPDRVRLVYNGVDQRVFYPGSQTEARTRLGIPVNEKTILFIGNLFPVKGIDILIQACIQMAKSGLDFKLHVIGKGSLQAQIEKEIETYQLQTRVQLHGSIPNHQLPDWYRAASLFVLPSRSEGVPNVLLEASACGTPYIASRVGGIPEIAHFGKSWLVSPGDANLLAEAIRNALTQPVTHRSQQVLSRTHADSAKELVTLFQEAIDERSVANTLKKD